jgi:hypothetical protein
LISGCENVTSKPDCRLGSKLLIGLFVVVRDVSQETLQVPAPHGSRCRTPVDENQSSTLTPCSPDRKLDGGVDKLDRPSVVENRGAYAPRLCATRAVSTSVPRRTTTRSGLLSTARRTASSSVSWTVAGALLAAAAASICAHAVVAINVAAIVTAHVSCRSKYRFLMLFLSHGPAKAGHYVRLSHCFG